MPEIALLLGNGFSRAYNNDLFSYDALRNAADLSARLEEVFELVGTTDFEQVMRRLNEALQLLPAYDVPLAFQDQVQGDVNVVRTSLVDALTQFHPPGAHELPPGRATRCASFLRPFKRIFTLNYDLLLYWVIVNHLTDDHRDGFLGAPPVWRGPSLDWQTVYYVHGALHLFDTGSEVRKLIYQPETPILEQLAAEMQTGNYPLFVSEGHWRQKMSRIRSNPYLLDAYEALSANGLPLLIYGFNFSEQDQHILDAILNSKTPRLFIVLHTGGDVEARERVQALAERLARRKLIQVEFLESEDYSPWDL